MGTRVRQVKRSINNDINNLDDVRGQLGRITRKGNQSASRKVQKVQRHLSDQQLKLDFVLDRLAFHKAEKAELKRKVKALRARPGR